MKYTELKPGQRFHPAYNPRMIRRAVQGMDGTIVGHIDEEDSRFVPADRFLQNWALLTRGLVPDVVVVEEEPKPSEPEAQPLRYKALANGQRFVFGAPGVPHGLMIKTYNGHVRLSDGEVWSNRGPQFDEDAVELVEAAGDEVELVDGDGDKFTIKPRRGFRGVAAALGARSREGHLVIVHLTADQCRQATATLEHLADKHERGQG